MSLRFGSASGKSTRTTDAPTVTSTKCWISQSSSRPSPSVSICAVHENGTQAPTLPAMSVARTLNVLAPLGRFVYSFGLEQGAGAPASSWQSNLLPGSLLVNANVAIAVDGFDGVPVILATGAVVSATNV